VVGFEQRDLHVGVDAVGGQEPALGVDERERIAGGPRLAGRRLGFAESDDVLRQRALRHDLPVAAGRD